MIISYFYFIYRYENCILYFFVSTLNKLKIKIKKIKKSSEYKKQMNSQRNNRREIPETSKIHER